MIWRKPRIPTPVLVVIWIMWPECKLFDGWTR